MGKVVGVISLKGGVGKTSSVVALGAALSEMGKSVLLVDGNLSAPNLGLHLDLFEPKATIHDVLSDKIDIMDSIQEVMNMHVISASVSSQQKIDPLKLRNKLRPLKNKYDVILLDSSPSLNDETLGVMMASDELIVVTTPDYSTLSMTLKSVGLAKKKGTPISGLILNKVRNKRFELSLEDIEKTSEVPVMAVIPDDISVLKSQANFIPPTYFKPNSRGNREYKHLASTLVGERIKDGKRFWSFKVKSPKRQEINREIFYESTFR